MAKRTSLPLPESAVVRVIRDGCARLGISCYRLNSGAVTGEYQGKRRFVRFSFEGCPDLVALLGDGRTLWIECKSAIGRLSPAQERFRDECQKRQVPWVLARCWEDVEPWLRVPR